MRILVVACGCNNHWINCYEYICIYKVNLVTVVSEPLH